jgi:hypothetical protein
MHHSFATYEYLIMSRKRNILIVTALTCIVGANIAFWTSRYHGYFSTGPSPETRQALGCIDKTSQSLIESFRAAVDLKNQHEVPPAARLNWLQSINFDASGQLTELGECYEVLTSLQEMENPYPALEEKINALLDLYEPIFLAEAVGISKEVRELVGRIDSTGRDKDRQLPSDTGEVLLSKAETAVREISSEIVNVLKD